MLLNLRLTEKDFNNTLRDRMLTFMEEMAISKDKRVVELVTVEILEPIFRLDFKTYQLVKRFINNSQIIGVHSSERL